MNVKIALYGADTLLVSWLEEGSWQRKFQRYNSHAKPVGKIEVLPVRASPRADMKNDSHGNVVWAHQWGDNKRALKIVRIRYQNNK